MGLFLVFLVTLSCSPQVTPTASPPQTKAPTVAPTTTAPPAPKTTASPSATVKATTLTPTTAGVSFAGKTITIVGTTAAGGGGDLMTRVFAKYLPKYLPGNPTIIVRNMPGGSNTVGANYVYQSKPDGLTLLLGTASVVSTYVVGNPAVRYDLQKMPALLGNPGGNWYYTKPSVARKVEDLPKAQGIVFGHSASSSNTFIFIIFCKVVDIRPEKVVTAYSGAADARRALLAGEINTTSEGLETYTSALAPYLASGEIVALFQSGIGDEKGEIVSDPGYPASLPTVRGAYERIYGKSPSGIAWDAYKALVAGTRSFKNLLLLPPAVPDSILRAYWNAADKMLKEPEFRKTVEQLQGEQAPWGVGEAYSKQFNANMAMDPKVLDWIKGALGEYGVVLQ